MDSHSYNGACLGFMHVWRWYKWAHLGLGPLLCSDRGLGSTGLDGGEAGRKGESSPSPSPAPPLSLPSHTKKTPISRKARGGNSMDMGGGNRSLVFLRDVAGRCSLFWPAACSEWTNLLAHSPRLCSRDHSSALQALARRLMKMKRFLSSSN